MKNKKTYGKSNPIFMAIVSDKGAGSGSNRIDAGDCATDTSCSDITSSTSKGGKIFVHVDAEQASSARQRNTNPKEQTHSYNCGKQKNSKNSNSQKVLADVSNTDTFQQRRPQCRNRKKAKKQPNKERNEVDSLVDKLPNFDSFDDYSLVVQSVTPIKTTVSQSATSLSAYWEKFSTSVNEFSNHDSVSPITSSPNSRKTIDPRICLVDDVAHKMETSNQHTEYDSYHNMSSKSASRLLSESKRAKRIRQRVSHCIETSTPEQYYRKKSRIEPPESDDLSSIPILVIEEEEEQQQQQQQQQGKDCGYKSDSDDDDEDDYLVNSIHQLSLHESLHETSYFSCSTKSDAIKASSSEKLTEGDNSRISKTFSRIDTSPLLFSDSDFITRSISNLEDLLEEDEEEEKDLQCSSYRTCSIDGSSTSIHDSVGDNHSLNDSEQQEPAGVLHKTPIRSFVKLHRLDDDIESLTRNMALLESPSLKDLKRLRLEKCLLRECTTRNIMLWDELLEQHGIKDIKKIGEGVYGEVFHYVTHNEHHVVKVVPTGGSCEVNGEAQRSLDEITKEIKITRVLSDLGYNFVKTNRVVCTEGHYPLELLEAWDVYDENKESQNDRPDYFPADQKYIMFDFTNGGKPLETYEFSSAAEGLSILLQIAWSLALAEQLYQFEHRDLHWSNVLVMSTDQSQMTYIFPHTGEFSVKSHGVKATIIDYTLSRLKVGSDVFYCDLSDDESLFKGYGDYQFDVYRQMKDVTRNEWKGFRAVTNILWFRYLVDKLIRSKTFPSRRGMKPSTVQFKKDLMSLYDRSSKYLCTVEMVCTDDFFEKYCDFVKK